MTSNEFVEQLTRATHPRLTKVQVRKLLDAFIRIVRNLPAGEQLILSGFGAFRKHVNPPRIVYAPPRGTWGEMPRTEYAVPAIEVVKFRAFNAAKKRLARDAPKK